MTHPLEAYVRRRCIQLGLSVSALFRRAGLSRQTLYELSHRPDKLPTLTTVVALAEALEVHPMRVLQCLFESAPLKLAQRRARNGDRSGFVADGNLPDGSLVTPGQRFEKLWVLQNLGTVPWHGRLLACQDDEVALLDRRTGQALVSPGLQPVERSVPVPDTLPGETVQVRAEFVAPAQPCTAISYWKMTEADDRLCFPAATGVWVMVKVVAPATFAKV